MNRHSVWLHTGILKVSEGPIRATTDLQVLQPGQVSEGPFLDDSQTVDILQRTAGINTEEKKNSSLEKNKMKIQTNSSCSKRGEAISGSGV